MAPPNRRNERERNRVKQVNQGFAMLRSHIPSIANTKKLSKVITLRSAVNYIRTLEQLLHHDHPSTFAEVPHFNHYNGQSSHMSSSGPFGQSSNSTDQIQSYDRYDRYTLQENAPQSYSSSTSTTVDSPISSGVEMSSAMSSVDLQVFAENWNDWR